MTVFKKNMDGDAGIMVGIGNDITAVAEIIDSCIVTPIVAILREIHIQGITASDSVTRWFFIKNAALYGAVVGNGRSKRAIFNLAVRFIGNGRKKAAGNSTMICERRGRRKLTATDFSVIYHSVVENSPNNDCISSNREFTFGDRFIAGNN